MFRKLLITVSLFSLAFLGQVSNIKVAAAIPPTYPTRVQLIIAYTQANDINTLRNKVNSNDFTMSNEGQFKPWMCYKDNIFSTAGGQIGSDVRVKGIADHEDGISVQAIANAQTFMQTADPDLYQFNEGPINDSRNCLGALETAADKICGYPVWNPRNANDFNYITGPIAVCAGINHSALWTGQNPVYAFQFNARLTFPEAQKAQLSDQYRNITGASGTYDGVDYTWTYYTHSTFECNLSETNIVGCDNPTFTGNYVDWYNPTTHNQNGGWLIYPYYNAL